MAQQWQLPVHNLIPGSERSQCEMCNALGSQCRTAAVTLHGASRMLASFSPDFCFLGSVQLQGGSC